MANDIDISLDSLLVGSPYFCENPTIGVALSGGRDSVALLHYLKSHGVKVVAINVEHGIRGESSLRDSRFAAELCADMGVELYGYSVDAPSFAKENGYTLEQAARILRYRVFDEALEDKKCDYIALAHHLDDQVETVFMRILRGTGIRGLVGMKKVNGRYIRPFLGISREDIDAYVERNGLRYVEDETNADIAYTRNYLRNELKRLKERFPSMGEAVERLCESAAEADEFIEAQIPEIEVKCAQSYIKISDCEDKLIAKRLILKAAKALGVTQDIEERHLGLVIDLLGAQNGKYLMLTHGLCVHKDADCLVFELRRERSVCGETPFSEGEFVDFGVSVSAVNIDKIEDLKRGGILYADAEKIPESAVIRTRRDGDYINKFGGGSKSLGDYLTDKKVPLRMRDTLAVIADGSRILAVFGLDISADVAISADTQKAYGLSIIK